jgi:hypothetical protein
MVDKDLDSPFAWLRRVLNNAVITGKAPGTNGNGNGNGHGSGYRGPPAMAAARLVDALKHDAIHDDAARKAYYSTG